MNKQPISYLQTDPRWKNVSYSAKGESTTIGRAGCGPTAMAMVLATWADPAVNPKTEAAWALSHGYKYPHRGTDYRYFAKAAARYGLDCKQITPAYIYGNSKSPYHEQAKEALDRGDLVIACMGKGLWTSSGHYVLVWKIDGSTVYINDPASTRAVRTRGDYLLFRQQVKLYWIIKCPESKKEEPDMTEKETKALIDKALKEDRAALLADIKKMIEAALPPVYNTEEDIPDWYRLGYDAFKDVIEGTGTGLHLSENMLRLLTMLARKSNE